MKKIFTILLLTLSVLGAKAFEIPLFSKDSVKNEKYKFFIKGYIETVGYTDSHSILGSLNGAWIVAPAAPDFSPTTGADLNQYTQFRLEAASSRFGSGGSIQLSDNSSVDGYLEFDFLNQNAGATFVALRLRHVYARLNFGKSSLLFGQTTHLTMFEEATPSVISNGGGSPYNILSRPVQLRYTQNFSSRLKFDVALSMFYGPEFNIQANAIAPDLSARLILGKPKGNSVALTGGVKFLAPNQNEKSQKIYAPYIAITGKYNFENILALKAFVIYGSDLSTFAMMGGYAPLQSGEGYAAVNSYSTWVDLATMRYDGFEAGLFAGYQQRIGASQQINSNAMEAMGLTAGIDSHWAIAPRLWYHYKMLSFGVEYMYAEAGWMNGTTANYKPLEGVTPTRNNRYTLLARFTF